MYFIPVMAKLNFQQPLKPGALDKKKKKLIHKNSLRFAFEIVLKHLS